MILGSPITPTPFNCTFYTITTMGVYTTYLASEDEWPVSICNVRFLSDPTDPFTHDTGVISELKPQQLLEDLSSEGHEGEGPPPPGPMYLILNTATSGGRVPVVSQEERGFIENSTINSGEWTLPI